VSEANGLNQLLGFTTLILFPQAFNDFFDHFRFDFCELSFLTLCGFLDFLFKFENPVTTIAKPSGTTDSGTTNC